MKTVELPEMDIHFCRSLVQAFPFELCHVPVLLGDPFYIYHSVIPVLWMYVHGIVEEVEMEKRAGDLSELMSHKIPVIGPIDTALIKGEKLTIGIFFFQTLPITLRYSIPQSR